MIDRLELQKLGDPLDGEVAEPLQFKLIHSFMNYL